MGGAAAYAYGAERPTDDADCVVAGTGEPRTACWRPAGAARPTPSGGDDDAEAQLFRSRSMPHLDLAGMSTWMTDAGGFDVLAGLEAADGHLVPYDELVARARVIQGNGFVFRLRHWKTSSRQGTGEPAKDREALPELRSYGTPASAMNLDASLPRDSTARRSLATVGLSRQRKSVL